MTIDALETATVTAQPARTASTMATATLLGGTAVALFVHHTFVRLTNPYPAAAEVPGVVQDYIDAATEGVRQVLTDAAVGMGAEDEEVLPHRLRQLGSPTPSTVRELARHATDASAPKSVRRAAIIGLGILAAGDQDRARSAVRSLLADSETGIAEAAVRAVDWGALGGLEAELGVLAADSRRPTWLRSYAADLVG